MEVGNRRKSAGRSVVAGSVWESRMIMDEVKGGIKVFFKGEGNSEEVKDLGNESLKQNQSDCVVREKRKTWNCEPLIDPSLIRKTISDESSSSFDEFHDSVDGFEKKQIHISKFRPDMPFNQSVDVVDKTLIQKKKTSRNSNGRSFHSHKISDETSKEFNGGYEKDEVLETKKEIEVSKQNSDVTKEVTLPELKPKTKKVLILKEKVNQIPKSQRPISPIGLKQKPIPANQSLIHSTPTRQYPVKVPVKTEKLREETQNKFQTLVDLVMWKDILISSLVFGIGALILLLPFLTEDLNFSMISAFSYVGLLCIAVIFLYKGILCREPKNLDDSDHQMESIGEEEAVCLLKLVLPWLNKFILEIRHLLSGDPATTMKFVVSLFILARCGSYITLWSVATFSFFGVFTIPRVYSLYSEQLSEEGTWWFSHCKEAWNSYPYLKGVAVAVFTLVWSLSSVLARVLEVFLLIVATKYFQEKLTRKNELGSDKEGEGFSVEESNAEGQ